MKGGQALALLVRAAAACIVVRSAIRLGLVNALDPHPVGALLSGSITLTWGQGAVPRTPRSQWCTVATWRTVLRLNNS